MAGDRGRKGALQKRNAVIAYFWSEKLTLEFALWVAGLFLGMAACLILAFAFFTPLTLESLSYSCWVRKTAGVYCPGCGGTRAFLALLHGDVVSSFLYHPVVPYMGILYVVFMFRGVVHFGSKGRFPFMKFHLVYIYVAVGITLVQFLAKNICLLVFHITWI